MATEDSAFIFCTSCRRAFFLELLTDEEMYPLPSVCPFCAGYNCLDDLDGHLEEIESTVRAEALRSTFAVLRGGKTKEDTNGSEEGSGNPDVDHRKQDEGGGEGPG